MSYDRVIGDREIKLVFQNNIYCTSNGNFTFNFNNIEYYNK